MGKTLLSELSDEEITRQAYNVFTNIDWITPAEEVTCRCEACGLLLDVGYRLLEGGKLIVFEPRSDVAVLLTHKPEPINDAPACGGHMDILAGPSLFRLVAQDEPLEYVDNGYALHDLLELVDRGAFPRNYIKYHRLRYQGKLLSEIASTYHSTEGAVYQALARGDKVLKDCAEDVKNLLLEGVENGDDAN